MRLFSRSRPSDLRSQPAKIVRTGSAVHDGHPASRTLSQMTYLTQQNMKRLSLILTVAVLAGCASGNRSTAVDPSPSSRPQALSAFEEICLKTAPSFSRLLRSRRDGLHGTRPRKDGFQSRSKPQRSNQGRGGMRHHDTHPIRPHPHENFPAVGRAGRQCIAGSQGAVSSRYRGPDVHLSTRPLRWRGIRDAEGKQVALASDRKRISPAK